MGAGGVVNRLTPVERHYGSIGAMSVGILATRFRRRGRGWTLLAIRVNRVRAVTDFMRLASSLARSTILSSTTVSCGTFSLRRSLGESEQASAIGASSAEPPKIRGLVKPGGRLRVRMGQIRPPPVAGASGQQWPVGPPTKIATRLWPTCGTPAPQQHRSGRWQVRASPIWISARWPRLSSSSVEMNSLLPFVAR